jgi:hypothetical protein
LMPVDLDFLALAVDCRDDGNFHSNDLSYCLGSPR